MKSRLLPEDQPTLSPEDHRARHIELHARLDEIIADFIVHTRKLPSETTLSELMEWSAGQTKEASWPPSMSKK